MTPPLSADAEQRLYDLYYINKNLFGRDKLYKLAVSKGITASRRQIMEFLREQEIHQLYAPANKTKDIARTVLRKAHNQIGIDLIDMQSVEYDGMRYILTAYDLFSKKAYGKELKNKEGKTVAKALEDIITKQIGTVSSIRSDNGSEFISAPVKAMLKKHNIKQVLSLPNKPQSNGGIERFNKTLKSLLRRSMKIDKTHDWVQYLQQVIKAYNSVEHDITKQAPNELDKGETENTTAAYIKIRKNARNKRQSTKVKLNIGDKVRIKLSDDDPIKFNTGEIWSKKLYKVYKIAKPKSELTSPSFQLKDVIKKKSILPKKFYTNDLLYIPRVRNVIDEPEKYEISRLVRPVHRRGVQSYEVKWKGYTDKDNTIESREQLLKESPKTVKKYEKDYEVQWYKSSVKYKR